MDLVIVRENTEGFYADRNMYWGVGEFMPTPDMALAVRKITAESSRRIAVSGFPIGIEPAQESDGGSQSQRDESFRRALSCARCAKWRKIIRSVAYDEQLVDSMAALLVRDAARFDVVVTTNMFGDIFPMKPPNFRQPWLGRITQRGRIARAWHRRSTAPRRISPARTKPIPLP